MVWLIGLCGEIYNASFLLESSAGRPRLKLLPRTIKDPVNEVADQTQQMSIFGGAKPRDEKKYEDRVYEEKAKEKLGPSQNNAD